MGLTPAARDLRKSFFLSIQLEHKNFIYFTLSKSPFHLSFIIPLLFFLSSLGNYYSEVSFNLNIIRKKTYDAVT